ncbi:MAG: phosphodiesterase [Hyphomicrobiales bacterium]|nr:MAG: phosphodiesterase [Hyphomicrobiales bacterium]
MSFSKFIHLTDCHVVGGDAILYGMNPRARLEQAVASINDEHGDAEFVVVSGDLTHWGDEDAYLAFSEQINRLSMPYMLMMGNHDNTEAFAHFFPDSSRDHAGFIQSVHETTFGRFLFLDTSVTGTHAGGYCQQRLDWLEEQLETSHDPVLIFMHHPPFPVGIKGMDGIMMQDSEAFHKVLAPYKEIIRHLFFGHIHRPIFGNWRDISFSCMRGLNHQVALDLNAPDTIVHGNFEPPAYGIVLVNDDQIVVHMHEFLNTSPRFTLAPPEGQNAREYALGFAPVLL